MIGVVLSEDKTSFMFRRGNKKVQSIKRYKIRDAMESHNLQLPEETLEIEIIIYCSHNKKRHLSYFSARKFSKKHKSRSRKHLLCTWQIVAYFWRYALVQVTKVTHLIIAMEIKIGSREAINIWSSLSQMRKILSLSN